MIAWRIAVDTAAYRADDMTGAGAEATGGRWNSKGRAMVYASSSTALACLETMVHFGGVPPLDRFLVRIDIPDALFAAATMYLQASLPVGWDVNPAGRAATALGDRWLASRASALLVVPSAIAPEDANLLIDPTHPDSGSIVATKMRRWTYDPRLFDS